MKKLGLLLVAVLMSANVFAKNASLFSYNHAKVEKALVSATALDHFVSNNMLTADQLNVDNPVVANFKASANAPVMGPNSALGIPGFVWGLILGWVGILIVYLVTEDQEETKKALYGCIVGTLLWVGCYFLLWGAIFTSSTAAASSY